MSAQCGGGSQSRVCLVASNCGVRTTRRRSAPNECPSRSLSVCILTEKSQPFASHNPAMQSCAILNAANATKESAQAGFSHGLQDFMHHRSVIVR